MKVLDEGITLETLYELIIEWDTVGKRSRRDLARRIIAMLKSHPLYIDHSCTTLGCATAGLRDKLVKVYR